MSNKVSFEHESRCLNFMKKKLQSFSDNGYFDGRIKATKNGNKIEVEAESGKQYSIGSARIVNVSNETVERIPIARITATKEKRKIQSEEIDEFLNNRYFYYNILSRCCKIDREHKQIIPSVYIDSYKLSNVHSNCEDIKSIISTLNEKEQSYVDILDLILFQDLTDGYSRRMDLVTEETETSLTIDKKFIINGLNLNTVFIISSIIACILDCYIPHQIGGININILEIFRQSYIIPFPKKHIYSDINIDIKKLLYEDIIRAGISVYRSKQLYTELIGAVTSMGRNHISAEKTLCFRPSLYCGIRRKNLIVSSIIGSIGDDGRAYVPVPEMINRTSISQNIDLHRINRDMNFCTCIYSTKYNLKILLGSYITNNLRKSYVGTTVFHSMYRSKYPFTALARYIHLSPERDGNLETKRANIVSLELFISCIGIFVGIDLTRMLKTKSLLKSLLIYPNYISPTNILMRDRSELRQIR